VSAKGHFGDEHVPSTHYSSFAWHAFYALDNQRLNASSWTPPMAGEILGCSAFPRDPESLPREATCALRECTGMRSACAGHSIPGEHPSTPKKYSTPRWFTAIHFGT